MSFWVVWNLYHLLASNIVFISNRKKTQHLSVSKRFFFLWFLLCFNIYDDDKHFSLTDVFYCWNLLCISTIIFLFSFELISYCAYLIIISIEQLSLVMIVSKALVHFDCYIIDASNLNRRMKERKKFDRVLIIVETNERSRERMAFESSIDIKLQIKADLLSQRNCEICRQ